MVKCFGRHVFLLLIFFVIILIVMYVITLSRHDGKMTADHSIDVQPEEIIDDMQIIRHIAQRIWNGKKPVLVTVINDAYLPFANSWLCNTIYMGIHDQVVIVTTDAVTRDVLARQWPSVHVVALTGQQDLTGNQKFSHAGYMRIMILRARILMEMLQEAMEVLLFEVDCVWLTNPIPLCQEKVIGWDMLATAVTNRPDIIAGGFLYLKPTPSVLQLWGELTGRLEELHHQILSLSALQEISDTDNDQTYLNRLVANGFANVKVKVMPLEKFQDGRWYKKSREERKRLSPLIINNNWVSKNKGKIRRARKFHHWFWKSSGKCDVNLVKAVVKS